MKNFILAILISLVLVYAFGNLFSDWWGIHLMMGDEMFSPLENLVAFSAIGVVFVIIGFIVAVSVIGTIALAIMASFAALLFVGLGAFWPVLLIVAAVWLYKRSQQKRVQASQW